MSGRPDYDVGDLVVCVDDRLIMTGGRCGPLPRSGSVYRAVDIIRPGEVGRFGARATGWGVCVEGCLNLPCGYFAARFRKLDPKPPEFWTREVEAEQRDEVPA